MSNLEIVPDTLKNDIERSLSLLKYKIKRTSDNYGRVYAKTNERTDLYFPDLKLLGKSLLTVEASGDHFLQGVLEGATSITTFDINPLTNYVASLKRAGIEELSHFEYTEYFDIKTKNILENSPNEVNNSYQEDTYIQLRKSLTPEVREFWDQMYNKGKFNKNYDKFFMPKSMELGEQPNSYLNPQNYLIVKDRIKRVNHQFISSDLLSLPLIINNDEKYNGIVLSNIYDWLLPDQQGKKFVNFINEKISPMLAQNGKCAVYYAFAKADPLLQRNFKSSTEIETITGKTKVYTYMNKGGNNGKS